MKFTITIIAAIFATISLAAPKDEAESLGQNVSDFPNVPGFSAEALARYEAVIASPSTNARDLDTSINKRAPVHLFVCQDASFFQIPGDPNHKCENLSTEPNVCRK